MMARRSLQEYPTFPEELDTDSSHSQEDLSESGVEEIKHERIVRDVRKPLLAVQKKNYPVWTILLTVLALLVGVSSILMYKHFNKPRALRKDWKEINTKILSHLMEKGDKFPSQKENVWYQILSELEGLTQDPTRPAVYLLTYDEGSIHPSSCVVEIITTAANKYLLDKSGWSLLNGSLLSESTKSDPGILIEAITSAVEMNKIIVVTDVQHIPAKLARGFHFLVDKYNPKVEEAIYVLTLKIPASFKNEKPVLAAEETLKECWKELTDDTLQPLVTRMTVQVLPINAEKSQKNCPLKTTVTNEIFIS